MAIAHDEARFLRHNYVAGEHILLGLIRDDGVAARALESCELTATTLRREAVRTMGSLEGDHGAKIPFTPRAKRALELAFRSTIEFGHPSVGPGHLFLGLLDEERDVRTGALTNLGVDPAMLRTALLQTERWSELEIADAECFLAHDMARRVALRAAELASADARGVEAVDLLLAIAELDELARQVLTNYVSLKQLAADVNAARGARDRGGTPIE